MNRRLFIVQSAAAALAGCAGYRWTSRVPEELRTVAVPNFENRSKAAELGPIVAQYVRREFQREGTFKLRRTGDAAIEIQGVVKDATSRLAVHDRNGDSRANEYRYFVSVEVSIVDKLHGKVLQEARKYLGETTVLTQGDLLTGQRNAAARIAADLARQIVDDVTSYPYNRPTTAP